MALHDPFSVPFPPPAPPKGRRRSTDGQNLRVNGSSVGRFFGGGKGLRRQVNSGKEFRERGLPGSGPGFVQRRSARPEAPPRQHRETDPIGSPAYAGKPHPRSPAEAQHGRKPRPAYAGKPPPAGSPVYAGKSARKSSQPRSSASRGASTPFSISEMAAARGSIVARHEVSSGSSAFSPVRSATKRR